MKTLKRIINLLLGVILVGAVGMVGVILYAEYSGSRFTPDSAETLAELDFSDGESRLVYDENGNIAELPGEVTVDTDTASSSSTEAVELPYVMDLGSALFHTQDCPYAANIADENRSAMTTTREKVLNAGYTPCTNCNP